MNQTARALACVGVTLSMTIVFPTTPTAGSQQSEESAHEFVAEAFPHNTAMVHFIDSWGARRAYGRRHRGTDVMSPRGTRIVAVADGFVMRMGWNRTSGWNIALQHADAWTSHYLHLNNDTAGTDDGEGGAETAFVAGLEVGDFVESGQVIGYTGDSGNAEGTRPHTHFELHQDGRKVNPFPFLVAAWDRQMSTYLKADLVA